MHVPMAKRRKAQDYLPFVAQSGYGILSVFLGCLNLYLYTAVSTKVVPQKCKLVRHNADWHYG